MRGAACLESIDSDAVVRAQARDTRPRLRPLGSRFTPGRVLWIGNIFADISSRYVRRIEHALLPACALACAHAHVDCGIVTRTALSRRALPCVTGRASLADAKARCLELVKKVTVNATIVSALAVRGVQRPRAAQRARASQEPRMRTRGWAVRASSATSPRPPQCVGDAQAQGSI